MKWRLPKLSVGASRPSHCGGLRRAGIAAFESLLVIPILLFAFLVAFEYGAMMAVHHAVMSAATEAAREGAKVPTDLATDAAGATTRILDALEATVETVLFTTHGLTVVPDSGVFLIVEDSTGIASRGQVIGTVPGATGITDASEVRVTIRVNFSNARVPNWLSAYCLDLSGKYFEMSSISRRDCV